MFSSLCRASKPVWYVAAVERKIATKTRGVRARLLRGRALSATRAGIYLNLKLGNRSQAAPGFPRFRRLFSLTLSLFLLFLLLSCSLSFILTFRFFPSLLPNDPTSWLSRTSNSRLLSIVSAPGTSLEKLINVSRWPIPSFSLFLFPATGAPCARTMRRGTAWETCRHDATKRRVS